MDGSIRITEVGPRDGLQNESAIVSLQDKVRFVELLAAAGAAEIEVSSFVSPKWVPQLADAGEVLAQVRRRKGVVYSALVPNEQGMERALAARVDKVAFFTAASETFCLRNINATFQQSLARLRAIASAASAARLPLRAYISCAVACPYEGPTDPRRVREVVAQLLEHGCTEIDLGETIGVAVPADIERLYDGLAGLLDPGQTTLHLHDTRGTALACALRALDLGVRSFDASCGGLGGCPYAPGAAGNLATEDLVYACSRSGLETGVSLEALFEAARHMAAVLDRALPGRVFNADGRRAAGAAARRRGQA